MKRVVLIFVLIAASSWSTFAQTKKSSPADSVSIGVEALADAIVVEAEKYLGRPYVWAANGPGSFDCTGYTKYVFGKFGYKLRRTVKGQMTDGRRVEGSLTELQKGDILIFGGIKNKTKPGHAAIFISCNPEGNDGTFIHAAKGGVQYNKLSEKYYKERFLGAVRILPDFVHNAVAQSSDSVSVIIPQNTVVSLDTLTLGEGDRRIILFENGTWAVLEADGTLRHSKENAPVYLMSNGQWAVLKESSVRIPTKAFEEEEQKPSSTQSSSSSNTAQSGQSQAQYHTVVAGDMLSSIAVKYHTSVKTLCRLNNMKETDILKLGKKIRVK